MRGVSNISSLSFMAGFSASNVLKYCNALVLILLRFAHSAVTGDEEASGLKTGLL